jgi:dienelactone hydrolase
MGYYAFVADIYGEGNYPKYTKGKQAGYYKNNVGEYQRRIQLALDQLVKSGANPDNIVVIGYVLVVRAFWSSKSRYESSGSRIVSWWFRPRCSPSKQCNKSASSSTMVQMIYMFLQLK